jgi:hypothetical protein
VENSIDAGANEVVILRGKEKGHPYLKISDNGKGVPKNEAGIPNFEYVATHICDSIKKKLKERGAKGIQGEFGIGLLSFWTVGEKLVMSSAGDDGHMYQMIMSKDKPGYQIQRKNVFVPQSGTELLIAPLLPGLRNVNGEKIQNYLASELRERILSNKVRVKIIDRTAKKEMLVEPKAFEGRALKNLPVKEMKDRKITLELYFNSQSPNQTVGLYRLGTRVQPSIANIDAFSKSPWTSGYLTGLIDAPFLNLTPGTRDGVIRDQAFMDFCEMLKPTEEALEKILEEQKQAEDEKASQEVFKSIQKAFKEAIGSLPPEEYDWFEGKKRDPHGNRATDQLPGSEEESVEPNRFEDDDSDSMERKEGMQKMFFEFAGPLAKCAISPASAVMLVDTEKTFRAIARDKSRRPLDKGVSFRWTLSDAGYGSLDKGEGEIVRFKAPSEPGLATLKLSAEENGTSVEAEAIITVTAQLVEKETGAANAGKKGFPGYTFHNAPGELWRSRFDSDRNLVIINKGHADFVYASRVAIRKLRYICKLYAKELVLVNFPHLDTEKVLERMIELSLRTEENL